MASFTPYPCCICKNRSLLNIESPQLTFLQNSCKVGELDSKKMLFVIFRRMLIFLNGYRFMYSIMDPEYIIRDCVTIDGNILDHKVDRMLTSIHTLLTRLYFKIPSVSYLTSRIKTIDNIYPILLLEMTVIVENHNKIAEDAFEILSGKATYQKLVLDILLFSAIFTSQCIDRFSKDTIKIYHKVVETVDKFFWDTNITSWIAHSVQVTQPFGLDEYNIYW